MFNVLLIFSSKVTENNLLRMARHYAISSSSLFFFLLQFKMRRSIYYRIQKANKRLQTPLVKYLEVQQQQQQ